jgi:hypothetical protein
MIFMGLKKKHFSIFIPNLLAKLLRVLAKLIFNENLIFWGLRKQKRMLCEHPLSSWLLACDPTGNRGAENKLLAFNYLEGARPHLLAKL